MNETKRGVKKRQNTINTPVQTEKMRKQYLDYTIFSTNSTYGVTEYNRSEVPESESLVQQRGVVTPSIV